VWNWLRLPGITVEQTDVPPNLRGVWPWPVGETDFVGAVTEGGAGLAVFEQAHKQVGARAHKSWFFFGDGVLALGAGISGRGERGVFTTLNQTRLRGPVRWSDGAAVRELAEGEHTLTAARWVWHDGVGYVTPERPTLWLENAPRTGDWTRVNAAGKRGAVTAPVFTLGLDHGVRPVAASYVYAVLPGYEAAATEAWAARCDVEVLVNTAALQAARDRRSGVAAAAFFEPGAWPHPAGFEAKAEAPCVVMLRELGRGRVRLSLAEPTQKLGNVTVWLAGRWKGPRAQWEPANERTRIEASWAEMGPNLPGDTVTGDYEALAMRATGHPAR
jgi:chondroitin AC lyase